MFFSFQIQIAPVLNATYTQTKKINEFAPKLIAKPQIYFSDKARQISILSIKPVK
jgi:hypothetical protein